MSGRSRCGRDHSNPNRRFGVKGEACARGWLRDSARRLKRTGTLNPLYKRAFRRNWSRAGKRSDFVPCFRWIALSNSVYPTCSPTVYNISSTYSTCDPVTHGCIIGSQIAPAVILKIFSVERFANDLRFPIFAQIIQYSHDVLHKVQHPTCTAQALIRIWSWNIVTIALLSSCILLE